MQKRLLTAPRKGRRPVPFCMPLGGGPMSVAGSALRFLSGPPPVAILQSLSALVLQPMLKGIVEAVGVSAVTAGKDAAVGFLTNHFTDHSQKLNLALQRANDRAWKALEIALSGDSWWSRCRSLLVPGDEKAVGQQIQ